MMAAANSCIVRMDNLLAGTCIPPCLMEGCRLDPKRLPSVIPFARH